MMERLRAGGHEITHDWVSIIMDRGEANPTDASVEERRAWADEDLAGVRAADAMVLLMPEGSGLGCFWEAGYAQALGIPMLVVGQASRTIFSAGAVCCADDMAAPLYCSPSILKPGRNAYPTNPLRVRIDDAPFRDMPGFVKYDSEKLRFDLLDPDFEEGIAEVLTLGAKKYSPDNWKRCPEPFERYYSALRRHIAAFAQGEPSDKETGLSHLLHAACCIQFLYHFELEGKLFEDDGG